MAACLAEATRLLSLLELPEAVIARIPDLALRCCFAVAAALFHVDDADADVLAQSGGPFEAEAAEVRRAAREAAHAKAGEVLSTGRLAVFPLPDGGEGLVLAIQRDGAHRPDPAGVDPLVAYASIAGAALARARASAALGEACCRESALVDAIREGVLAVDRGGVIRTLNCAGAAALGVRRETAIGRRLRDLPGFSALATALAAPGDGASVVTLPRGEVAIRAHRHDSGVVATVREVASEELSPQRTVGSVARYTFEHLVGESPGLREVIAKARRAAETDSPILLGGESGTGKEMLAQAIHDASARASEPFLAINVAAIPHELLESELFGYEGGTFTGARATGRAGKIELAGRGTLLLDEIGDMPAEMQAKLLRVLQERVVQRLGSARDIQVRARIIATTNRDLAKDVSAGRFRLDLYHRLCVIQLHLPPLRERRGDVRLVVEERLRTHAERTGRRIDMAPPVLAAFDAYHWPGNVRELVNVLDGALGILPAGEAVLTRVPSVLNGAGALAPRPRAISPEEVVPLEQLERRACEETLAAFGGNVKRAAMALGLARQTLYAKMKRYGIGNAAPSEHGAPPGGPHPPEVVHPAPSPRR